MKYFAIATILAVSAIKTQGKQNQYPAKWFEKVDPKLAFDWEILPQAAKKGEVILSKRTELGQFSNFWKTPFRFRGQSYASMEGFWQGMKFPDPQLSCLLYTSPSPRDKRQSRMPSSA